MQLAEWYVVLPCYSRYTQLIVCIYICYLINLGDLTNYYEISGRMKHVKGTCVMGYDIFSDVLIKGTVTQVKYI